MSAIINLDVPDIERAIEFYSAATGCRLERRLDDAVAELSCGAVNIDLLENAAGSVVNTDSDQRRHYSRHWTPVHIDFVVADLDEAIIKAENAGAVRESNAETWRGAAHVNFSDPFGHGFVSFDFVKQPMSRTRGNRRPNTAPFTASVRDVGPTSAALATKSASGTRSDR